MFGSSLLVLFCFIIYLLLALFISRFVLAKHDERAQMADSYIYETAEYFFERLPTIQHNDH